MKAIKHDFEIKAGNSGIISNEDGLVLVSKPGGVEEDFTGVTLHFATKKINGTQLVKTSVDGGILIEGGKITIQFSVADSRALPAGGSIPYEIEFRRGGAQRERVSGKIKVLKGVNLD